MTLLPPAHVIAPDVAQERGAFNDLSRPLVEVVEHLELELREVDTLAVDDELVLRDIEEGVLLHSSSAAMSRESQPSIDDGPKSLTATW